MRVAAREGQATVWRTEGPTASMADGRSTFILASKARRPARRAGSPYSPISSSEKVAATAAEGRSRRPEAGSSNTSTPLGVAQGA